MSFRRIRRLLALAGPLTLADVLLGGPLLRAESADAALAARGAGHRNSVPSGMRPAPPRPPLQGVEPGAAARRAFIDARDGQLHLRLAIRPRAVSAVPVVCLHDAPGSGRLFQDWLLELGGSRDVFAPDLPGYGDSDAPSSPPTVGDYAWSIGQLIDTMAITQVDLVGVGLGALVATDLAIERVPFVRRLVLAAVPIMADDERARRLATIGPPRIDTQGSHWMRAWTTAWRGRRHGRSVDEMVQAFADHAASGARDWWGLRATLEYPTRARLLHVTHPTLVFSGAAQSRGAGDRNSLAALLPTATVVPLPATASPARSGSREPLPFQYGPAAYIARAREFLD